MAPQPLELPAVALSSWPCVESLGTGMLVVNGVSGEPAPMAVLELLSCQCKRRCQLPSCTYLSNGLKCTDLCQLRDCDNWHEDPMEAIVDTDELEGDDD